VVAELSDKVTKPSVPAEVEPVAARMRPLTNSFSTAIHAIRRTLPTKRQDSET